MSDIRVLIVDDSRVVRRFLSGVLGSQSDLDVVGVAAHGAEALHLLETQEVDVIVLDLEMPVLDGINFLIRLRERDQRTAVVVFATHSQVDAHIALGALSAGADDFVVKPHGTASLAEAVHSVRTELLPRIRTLHASHTAARHGVSCPWPARIRSPEPRLLTLSGDIGAPEALHQVVTALPEDFPVPVVVVQSMPELFTRALVRRLETRARLRVAMARDRLPLGAGTVYVAPGGRDLHLIEGAQAGSLVASVHPPAGPSFPSFDSFLHSAALACGSGVVAVVLTGAGHDGLEGCTHIRECGGTVLAQDPGTAAARGRPSAVIDAGLADASVPLVELAEVLIGLIPSAEAEPVEMA